MSPYAFALVVSIALVMTAAGAILANLNPALHGHPRDRVICAALGGAAGLATGGVIVLLVYLAGKAWSLIGG